MLELIAACLRQGKLAPILTTQARQTFSTGLVVFCGKMNSKFMGEYITPGLVSIVTRYASTESE